MNTSHTRTSAARLPAVALLLIGAITVFAMGNFTAHADTQTGSVSISVAVSGGSANPSNFTVQIKKTGDTSNNVVSGSGNTLLFGQLAPGSYTITRTNGPSGYSSTWSGDCNASGVVIISANTVAHCTLTNTFGTTSGGGDTRDTGRTRPDRVVPVRPTR